MPAAAGPPQFAPGGPHAGPHLPRGIPHLPCPSLSLDVPSAFSSFLPRRWKYSVGFLLIPGGLLTIASPFMVDTPSSLLARGKKDLALNSLRCALLHPWLRCRPCCCHRWCRRRRRRRLVQHATAAAAACGGCMSLTLPPPHSQANRPGPPPPPVLPAGACVDWRMWRRSCRCAASWNRRLWRLLCMLCCSPHEPGRPASLSPAAGAPASPPPARHAPALHCALLSLPRQGSPLRQPPGMSKNFRRPCPAPHLTCST